MGCSRTGHMPVSLMDGSNNTNKWDAQEHPRLELFKHRRSNNTNKWDAQELLPLAIQSRIGSNNTNKWDAQEQRIWTNRQATDQIIPINGMLKNA